MNGPPIQMIQYMNGSVLSKGQVYEWGRFRNTGSHTRTKIIPVTPHPPPNPPMPPPPPPRELYGEIPAKNPWNPRGHFFVSWNSLLSVAKVKLYLLW